MVFLMSGKVSWENFMKFIYIMILGLVEVLFSLRLNLIGWACLLILLLF